MIWLQIHASINSNHLGEITDPAQLLPRMLEPMHAEEQKQIFRSIDPYLLITDGHGLKALF